MKYVVVFFVLLSVHLPCVAEQLYNFETGSFVLVNNFDTLSSVEMRQYIPQTTEVLEMYDDYITEGLTPQDALVMTLEDCVRKIHVNQEKPSE